MLTLATLVTFLPIVLAVQAIPRPGTMLVVGRGIGQGRHVALWTASAQCRPESCICRFSLLALHHCSQRHHVLFLFLVRRPGG